MAELSEGKADIVFAFSSPMCYFASRRFQQVRHARICQQCSKL
jgi:2-hydroxychromene-2-carboxylate isomerase